MNERIEYLALLANHHANELHPNNLDMENWAKVYHEKFAELVVRECCIALNPMLRDMISRGQGVDLIKLHFGMNPKEITTAMLDAAITQCEQELAKKKSGVEE